MFASKTEQRRVEFLKKTRIVDEFNQKCSCGHRADEHIAGEGHCFKCDETCGKFNPIEPLTNRM